MKIAEIKKKWKNLNDSFKREKKKRDKYIPSGSCANESKKAGGFSLYERMLFLADHVENRQTIDNLSDEDVPTNRLSTSSDSSGPSSVSADKGALRSTVTTQQRKQSRGAKRNDDLSDIVNVLTQDMAPFDPLDGFLMHARGILRRLPYGEMRRTQSKIEKILYQAEEKCGLLQSDRNTMTQQSVQIEDDRESSRSDRDFDSDESDL